MSSFISDRYEKINIKYAIASYNGFDFFVILDKEDLEFVDNEKVKEAIFYFKRPTWVEIHEIDRLSSKKDPYTKKYSSEREKLRDFKLKKLLVKVEEDGEIYYFNDEIIDNMDPDLAIKILNEIDRIAYESGCYESLSKEEEKKLSFECFKYYSAITKKDHGQKSEIPLPPSAVIIKRICEMLHITPDEARSISRRDIEEMFIAEEQMNICLDPRAVGIDPDIESKRKR